MPAHFTLLLRSLESVADLARFNHPEIEQVVDYDAEVLFVDQIACAWVEGDLYWVDHLIDASDREAGISGLEPASWDAKRGIEARPFDSDIDACIAILRIVVDSALDYAKRVAHEVTEELEIVVQGTTVIVANTACHGSKEIEATLAETVRLPREPAPGILVKVHGPNSPDVEELPFIRVVRRG